MSQAGVNKVILLGSRVRTRKYDDRNGDARRSRKFLSRSSNWTGVRTVMGRTRSHRVHQMERLRRATINSVPS